MLIGKIFCTEKQPNTAEAFNFWTNTNANIGIGSIVKIENCDQENNILKIIYGVVVEGYSYTDLESPLHDYISAEYDPCTSQETLTERPEIRCYIANVLRMDPDEPLQPVGSGSVYLAYDEDVERSLRMDNYKDLTGIPAGLLKNGDRLSPVYLDSEFLLGPEAAHLNITGVSGLATKTSYFEFLLQSIFTHYKPSEETDGVAAVLFNVKGPDLLFLDQSMEIIGEEAALGDKQKPALTEDEVNMYDLLQIQREPFQQVTYYAPRKADRVNLNTLRTNEKLLHNVKPLVWGLNEIFEYVNVLVNKDDIDAKADAFLALIKERIIHAKPNPDYLIDTTIETFNDLSAWFYTVFEYCEHKDNSNWKGHAVATMRKVYNRLSNISLRCEGLVSNGNECFDLPWGNFNHKDIYVIDVAGMIPLAQDLVFTRVIEKLKEHLETGSLGVKKVIVFVDELNKYAAIDEGMNYLKKTLLEISERGRYLGLVLFSAQQFKTQVHKRIVGNAGTFVFGRMDMDELANPSYSTLSPAIKTKLSILPKGELMVKHPHFLQPIFVKFPRPVILKGNDGIHLFKPAVDTSFEEAMVRNFKRLNPHLKALDIKETIFNIHQDEVIRVFNELEKMPAEERHNLLETFKQKVRKVPTTSTTIEQQKTGTAVKALSLASIIGDDS